jgi:hypothetical protein
MSRSTETAIDAARDMRHWAKIDATKFPRDQVEDGCHESEPAPFDGLRVFVDV